MAGTTLHDLMRRYFVAGTAECPTFDQDSEWVPIIDGVEYFEQVRTLLDRAGPGDSAFFSGLQLAPELDLNGLTPGETGYRALADVLVDKAERGVDVRVMLTAAVFSGSVPGVAIGPFRSNVFSVRTLRERPALRGRALLDWSGAGIGCHHQKMIILHVGGELTTFVGGLDLWPNRFDADPHERLSIGDERWGWHDGAVRLRGPAAARVWEVYRNRWAEAAALPRRPVYFPPWHLAEMNPGTFPPVPPAPHVERYAAPGTALQVLRSFGPWRIDGFFMLHRRRWTTLPRHGVQEVFYALSAAIRGAQHYIYLEDQYLFEVPGGKRRFRLYGRLRDAAARGVKIILVCSGRKDPADGGVNKFRRVVTTDIQREVVDKLPPADRQNVIMYRVEDLTVHTKLLLIDDVFASVGSANFFSRSMRGTDTELSTVIVSTGNHVRDLRVALWAEHMRAPLNDRLRPALEDLELALGIWRPTWMPPDAPSGTWRTAGYPAGFEPAERVLVPVGPWPEPSLRPLQRAAPALKAPKAARRRA